MTTYSFITDKIIQTLRDNHDNTDFATESIADKPVVVKFFNPYGAGDWWAYSMDEHNRLFGIADIFEPEYGSFNLSELRLNSIERDLYYCGPETFGEVMKERKEMKHG